MTDEYRCRFHRGNVASILCEDCERRICTDCSSQHTRSHATIAVMDIDKAYTELPTSNYHTINKLKMLSKHVIRRTETVVNEIEKAKKRIIVNINRKLEEETQIAKTIEQIKDGDSSTEEKYVKTKKTLKQSFIKSIGVVDSSKAWILNHRDDRLRLIDTSGEVLEKWNFGEAIEDFCMTSTDEVIYTTVNGSELKKRKKKENAISLYDFANGYITRGLCHKAEDVVVCLNSTDAKYPNRLAKMSIKGNIANELEFDTRTSFCEPGKTYCKNGASCVIGVVDWNDTGRVVKGVDGKGNLRWEWKGQLEDGTKVSPFEPYDILFCNLNENKRFLVTLKGLDWSKICSIDETGADAKCIYTGDGSTCGAIAVDNRGQIWVGDHRGGIHIMAPLKV